MIFCNARSSVLPRPSKVKAMDLSGMRCRSSSGPMSTLAMSCQSIIVKSASCAGRPAEIQIFHIWLLGCQLPAVHMLLHAWSEVTCMRMHASCGSTARSASCWVHPCNIRCISFNCAELCARLYRCHREFLLRVLLESVTDKKRRRLA